MIDQERIEEVRLKVLKISYKIYCRKLPLEHLFDELLKNLKDKDGKPLLAILSDDQSLSEYDFTNTPTYFESGYNIAQQDMTNSNFRRVIIVGDNS